MLESNSLGAYGVALITLFMVIGYSYIYSDIVYKNEISLVGGAMVVLAWILYYDRAEPYEDKDDHLLPAILFVLFSSIALLYCEVTNKKSAMVVASAIFAISWFYLAWVLVESDSTEEKTQYIVFSVFLIVLSVVYFIPKQRKEANMYDIGLPMFAIGWTLLASSSVDSPVNDLLLY